MKTLLCRLLIVAATVLPAKGADPLTTAFQQGLLEEELNRNFTNAIAAYERVVQGLDEQRPLAATALFRLAECYRKLGQTNEAVAAYQRVLRDFTEEATLTKLSRENLVALGFGPPAQTKTNAASAAVAAKSDEAEEADRLAAQLAGIERLKNDPEMQAQAIQAFFPDEGLNRMLWHLDILKQQAAFARTNQTAGEFGFRFPIDSGGGGGGKVVVKLVPGTPSPPLEEYLAAQLDLIARRTEHILKGQQARLFVLQNGAASAAPAVAALGPVAKSDEADESDRLAAQLAGIERLKNDPEKQAQAVLAFFPDDGLKRMLLNLAKLQQQLTRFRSLRPAEQERLTEAFARSETLPPEFSWGAIGPEERSLHSMAGEEKKGTNPAESAVNSQLTLIADRVRFILDTQKARLFVLQNAVPGAAPAAAPAPATSEEADEIKRIQAIIRDSPDLVNAHNATGNGGTPLHAAAEKGYVSVTEYLLANHADVNAKDNQGRTPLHIAAQNGHKRLCEMLLAAGADVNAEDNDGYTPLHLAAIKGYLSVAETLLARGAQVNTAARDNHGATLNSPLASAAVVGSPAMVELLLAHGADLEYRDKDGVTPLIRVISAYPVRADREACVKVLLDKGANVNAVDVHGLNALAYAVRDAKMTLVTLLLDHRAEINAQVSAWIKGSLNQFPYSPGGWGRDSQDGNWTVLFMAVGSGNTETTRLLLDRGADINAKAASGITPVHWAVLQGKLDNLKLLLDHKADVNVRDSGGNMPLHYAVDNGRAELVEALLAAGADPNAPGWTNGEAQPWWPLFRAVTLPPEFSGPIVKALIAHGADVNAKTTNGWTALHQAVHLNQSDLAELLVANKAEVNAHGSKPKADPQLGERKAEGTETTTTSGIASRGWRPPQPRLMPVPAQQIMLPGNIPGVGRGGPPRLEADKDVTPLQVAVANQNLELAKFLLDHGADVNARDADGHTPLQFAVNRRDLDMIRLLLDAQADPDTKDGSGQTPVSIAVSIQDPYPQDRHANVPNRGLVLLAKPKDIIALLREHGAKEPPEPKPAKSIFETDPKKAKAGGQVSIFGAVRGNGLRGNLFALRPGSSISLSQALLAVGFADNAVMGAVKLTRVNPDTKQPETKTVNLLGLKRGEPIEEILLQDGDRVDVPAPSL